ncbi:MAG TPA: tRNA pseudouridine(38-40) synthase TruA [Fimbriimonadaceae bacterium]|nr:tRNA pseudouridine(38-40) synthase TruA [Fimbriimonadaceae bacterium]HRE92997.1 tRNA pseudouridine(38-40) synthase TruA [Fimbriimonadaceae bacterium]
MRRKPPSSSLSTKVHRIKFVVAYDGSDFRGWASQDGERTVHGILTSAVRQVTGEENQLWGASRTDAGAHAKGQVCHFDTATAMPIEKWPRVMTKALPNDVVVLKATQVADDFHSRFWAKHRHYQYRIMTGVRDPHRARYAYWSPGALDFDRMQAAAAHFVGTHDFLAFSSQSVPRQTNRVRTLYSVEMTQVWDEIRLDVVGTAFVRGMMRRIAGALWEVGRGARTPESIPELLQTKRKERIVWPTVLPAAGLTLIRVEYGRHPRPQVGPGSEAHRQKEQGQDE